MNDCDALLKQVLREAATLGIPVSKEISPHVEINDRAVNRFGCCKYREGENYIEVARRVAEGPEESCRSVLAHEILHTCWGCRNHGKRWNEYARRMREAYGYVICCTTTNEALGVEEERLCQYLLQCESCGETFRRFRASPLTRHPERYRCRCGGRIRCVTYRVDRWDSKEDKDRPG